MEASALHKQLGYKNGRPPKNVRARFENLLNRRADDFTKRTIRSNFREPNRSLNELISLYLYLTQAGGSPEEFIYQLGQKGELPGKAKGEKCRLSRFLTFEEMDARTAPVSRTLDLSKSGDPAHYHYTVSRASPASEWKLERAWRTAPDETTAEELHLP